MIARKRFGQHFLDAREVIDDILRAVSPRKGDHVVEIGPGRGALTRGLHDTEAKLTLIEIDRDLISGLRQRFPRAEVHNVDVLRFDFGSLSPAPLRLVGNLPYNISTPLMAGLMDHRELIQDMHFMLQREVAERIVSGPGTKSWGRLSVLLQLHCETELLFDVSPECFVPPPAVWSSVIRLRPRRDAAPEVNTTALDRVLKAVFGQRRKQLGNALKNLRPLDWWDATGIGLDFTVRAESVTLEQFVAMARSLDADQSAGEQATQLQEPLE